MKNRTPAPAVFLITLGALLITMFYGCTINDDKRSKFFAELVSLPSPSISPSPQITETPQESGVADFTSDTRSGLQKATVNFINKSTKSPTGYLWDFGDGSTDTVKNPSHTYNSPGLYTVSLTAAYGTAGESVRTKENFIRVGNSGVGVEGAGYDTIQEAIKGASDGDIILVGNGTYTEDLLIDKSITLAAGSSPVIDGNVLADSPDIKLIELSITGLVAPSEKGSGLFIQNCTYKSRKLLFSRFNNINPSFLKTADGTCLLFFGTGTLEGEEADNDFYQLTMARSTDNGCSWTFHQLPTPTLPGGIPKGAVTPASLQDGEGNIHVFYSVKGNAIYCYQSQDLGNTWTGPQEVSIGESAENIGDSLDAVFFNGKIHLFYEGAGAIKHTAFDGEDWSAPVFIGTGLSAATPRAFSESNESGLLLVYKGAETVLYAMTSLGTEWEKSDQSVSSTGSRSFQPCITNADGSWQLYTAPWQSPGKQWIIKTSSNDLSSWSSTTDVTSGAFEDTYWLDCWPEAFSHDAGVSLYYCSQSGPEGKTKENFSIWTIENP